MSSLIRATLLTAAVAACAWAADDAVRRSDLRVTIDALPTYEVSTSVSGMGGSDWRGLPNQVWQLGLEKLWLGERKDDGGMVYGLRVNAASQIAEPTGYDVDGTFVANTTAEELQWRRVGVGAALGWQTGPVAIDGIRLFGELTAFADVAAVYASLTNTVESDSSLGYGVEGGVRLALLMAESDWYGGIAVTAMAGIAQADLSVLGGTATSTVTLSRSGVGLGVVVGRRF